MHILYAYISAPKPCAMAFRKQCVSLRRDQLSGWVDFIKASLPKVGV